MERVVAVGVPRPHVLDVTFTDSARPRVDMEPELSGEVFAPLRDPNFFPELGTVVWPNGADNSLEYLYHGEGSPYGKIRIETPHKVGPSPA